MTCTKHVSLKPLIIKAPQDISNAWLINSQELNNPSSLILNTKNHTVFNINKEKNGEEGMGVQGEP